jgi:hypothetical protein
VLGGPECVAPILEIGKPLALIVYLACTPDRKPVPRDQVIDLLWADLEPDAARHALRQTLWHIKRRVSDSLLISSSESIELKPCVETDRELFLDASTRGDLERVVQLYAGDFLPASPLRVVPSSRNGLMPSAAICGPSSTEAPTHSSGDDSRSADSRTLNLSRRGCESSSPRTRHHVGSFSNL